MVVIAIERDLETVGAVHWTETDEEGEMQFWDTEGQICIRDYDFDDIFDTNEFKIRLDIDEYIDDELEKLKRELSPFRSRNHIGFYHEKDDVVNLVQELASYKAVLKSYNKGDYRDCGVLIENYFGHIDYWYHFGYNKTHAEIVSILYSNLLSQITGEKIEGYYEGDSSFFTDFCYRQIIKIINRLKDDYNIKDVDKLMEENWLP